MRFGERRLRPSLEVLDDPARVVGGKRAAAEGQRVDVAHDQR